MEQTIGTRAEIQRLLDQFTRGEIDFQALLAALDRAFLADPPARRVALELVDKQNPNGALQRSFFRVLKERIEQQLASGSQRPPRAAGGRDMQERSREATPPPVAQRPSPGAGVTRPFGSRPTPREERPSPEATRPFELTAPPQEEPSSHEVTAPFPAPRRARDEPFSRAPERCDPETERASPDTVPPSPDATRPFFRPAPDERANDAATSSPPPAQRATPEVADPFSPAPAPREDRFGARRRVGGRFGRGRYHNWERPASGSEREEAKEPSGAAPLERPGPAASAPDVVGVPTTPPNPGVIERAMHSASPAPATESEAAAVPTADEWPAATATPSSSETTGRESAATDRGDEHSAAAARETAAAAPEDEYASTHRESIAPVRSAPPPRTPFTGRQRRGSPAAAREPAHAMEPPAIAPPRPQPLAWIVGVLIMLLLFVLILLGPLREFVPGFAAFVEREIPAAFRSSAPAPEETREEVAPPAAAPQNEAASAEAGAPADSGRPTEPTAPPAAAAQPPTVQTGTGAPAPTKPAVSAPSASAPTKTPTPTPSAATAAPPKVATAAAPTGPGRFGFASRSYTGRESGGAVAIRIERRGGSSGAASVTWSTHEDSAAPGEDYADFGPVVEAFASGERERVIYVPLADDDVSEARESFSVELADPSGGAALDATSSATVTIVDDDS